MKLTGKAKELFEEWCDRQSPRIITWSARGSSYESVGLYDQPESMQWGVYQDWADSLGYFITNSWIGDNVFCPDITKDNLILWEDDFKTRQEARNAAIEKLNYLINQQ